MSQLKVMCFSVSVDGYGAGPKQDLANPLGLGAMRLHDWFIPTQVFQTMHGGSEGTVGVDNDFAARGIENVGAWILGRNMFGPVRGPWPNEEWKGWWGDTPPYRVPVFVLTHHLRPSLVMEGGTTFHFITDGIEAALAKAKEAAAGKDVRLGGGVSTLRQYLQARLIDEMHLAISPVVMGSGEHLFAGLDLRKLGYDVTSSVNTEKAMHLTITKATPVV